MTRRIATDNDCATIGSVDNKSQTQHEKRNWPRRALQMGLQYGGSGLVLYLLLRFLPKREIWNALRQLPFRLWVLVLGGYLAAPIRCAARYPTNTKAHNRSGNCRKAFQISRFGRNLSSKYKTRPLPPYCKPICNTRRGQFRFSCCV